MSKVASPGSELDFDAMAEHRYQISIVAHQHGIAIERVIFDQHLMKRLFSTSRHGPELRGTMSFMKRCSWIRHDEHHHIDSEFHVRHFANIAVSNWAPIVTLSIECNRACCKLAVSPLPTNLMEEKCF